MPRNGTGTFSLVAGNPVVTGTVVSSTWANGTLSDIATAMTQSIASTGVTTPSANLPMGTYRHTGVGNATVKAAYSSVTDIQNGSLVTLGAVAGSDTITATAPFTLSAYAAGQAFQFLAAGSNTGAVTINIDGLGAKSITKNGSNALAVGDITIAQVVDIVYDGTQFQMTNARPVAGIVVAMQAFTTSGTYTPTTGMSYCIVHMVGGGAGGTQNTMGNFGGGGGGAGEYATGVFSAAAIGASKTVTIGAGGAVNTSGGTTSLDTLLTAVGGSGVAANSSGIAGAGGTGGTGTGLHVPGGSGDNGTPPFTGPQGLGGGGGGSFFGSGGRGGTGSADNATAGAAYGSGGGGNGYTGAFGNAAAGAEGCIVIYEYL